MELPRPVSSSHTEEITLRNLILQMREWRLYLYKKWLIILLYGLVGAGLGLIYALNKKTLYVGELTFVLEDSKSSSLGVYTGLANQFGIDLSGSGGTGVFTGENIIEFMKSRLMVEKTLLSPIVFDGKQQSLAEVYLKVNKLRERWKNDSALENIQLPPTLDRKTFTIKQDSVLNTIYAGLVKSNLKITKPDRKLSFISVECTTVNDIFSKAFIEKLVKETIDFYVQTKTQRSKITVSNLQAKADSIESLLNNKTYSAAASQDLNLNPARSMAGVGTELVMRDKMVLQAMYSEVVKNLELSKMAMAQETPIIQIIDTPILPLKKKKFGKLKGLVLGGFLGVALILFYLIMKRIYNQIMYSKTS